MVASARDGGRRRGWPTALYMRSVAETSVGRSVHGAAMAGEAQAAATIVRLADRVGAGRRTRSALALEAHANPPRASS